MKESPERKLKVSLEANLSDDMDDYSLRAAISLAVQKELANRGKKVARDVFEDIVKEVRAFDVSVWFMQRKSPPSDSTLIRYAAHGVLDARKI